MDNLAPLPDAPDAPFAPAAPTESADAVLPEPQEQLVGGHRNRPVSWVRRGGRMTAGQAVAWQQHGHKYLIEPPRGVARESIAPGWQLNLPQEFGNAQPVIVEIGTGRGENIVAAARENPDTNFLGVEVYGPGLARAILLAEALDDAAAPTQPLTNLRLIQADAPEVLAALPPESVAEVWVFFPDPWPKNRHLKRRLINDDFANQVARVLPPGGVIRLATDWEHYAQQMSEVFTASSSFTPLQPDKTGITDRFNGRVLTAFEARGIREGRKITDLAFRCNASLD